MPNNSQKGAPPNPTAPGTPDIGDWPPIEIEGPVAEAPLKKILAVQRLARQFRDSQAVLVTHYRGLNDNSIQRLRAMIRDDAHYEVVKNTLAQIAAAEAGLPEIHLSGPTALAFVHGETTAVAKALRDFAASDPHLTVLGGIIDGVEVSAAEVSSIADVAPREVLLQRMATLMNSLAVSPAAAASALLVKPARLASELASKRATQTSN